MKNLILVLVTIFSLTISSDEYRYESIVFYPIDAQLISKDIIIIDTEYEQATCEQQKALFDVKTCKKASTVVKHVDLIDDAFVCDPIKNKMVCIFSKGLRFSIPYLEERRIQKWFFKGTEFNMIDNDFEIDFRGRKVSVYVVQSRRMNGDEVVYFFNDKYGLLGLNFILRGEGDIYSSYYLSSEFGYGHKIEER